LLLSLSAAHLIWAAAAGVIIYLLCTNGRGRIANAIISTARLEARANKMQTLNPQQHFGRDLGRASIERFSPDAQAKIFLVRKMDVFQKESGGRERRARRGKVWKRAPLVSSFYRKRKKRKYLFNKHTHIPAMLAA